MLPPTKTSGETASKSRPRSVVVVVLPFVPVTAMIGASMKARCELDLAYHLRSVLPRLLKQGVVVCHAGADDDQPVVEEVPLAMAAEPGFERDTVEGSDGARKLAFRLHVGGRHFFAEAGQELHARDAACPKAGYQDAIRNMEVFLHLSFTAASVCSWRRAPVSPI